MSVSLTPADKATELWHKLQKHYEARLATLRAQNDNDKGDRETANQRGRIAEVKAFLAIGQDRPEYEEPVPRIDAAQIK